MNKQVILAKRPFGFPDESTWNLEVNDIPAVSDGQMLVKISYISLDPAMRGWMNDTRSYIPPIPLGEVMRSGGIGKVIESKVASFKDGDTVVGMSGVQQFCVTDGNGWIKVDPNLAPLPRFLGTLGMPGMTAYFGLLDVGLPNKGDTVLISGAAGAVGSVVGQIAKIQGCKAVGIAGGAEKCAYVVDELGFDACIDYKNDEVKSGLKTYCPQGIDVYFDNVGGEILDLALAKLNRRARVVICGAISQYNNTTPLKGPSNYLSLLINGARMEGFVVFHFAKRYPEAMTQLSRWMAEGKIKSREHVDTGIENFRDVFLKLFTGNKRGKLVLNVSE